MAKRILVLLLMSYLALKEVSSEKQEEISFVENIRSAYTNGIWTCGGEKCDKSVVGCHIIIQNVNKMEVLQTVECIGGHTKKDTITLKKKQKIDVDLRVTAEAKNDKYFTKYSKGGDETAKGFVAVKDLPKLKEEFIAKKKKSNKSILGK